MDNQIRIPMKSSSKKKIFFYGLISITALLWLDSKMTDQIGGLIPFVFNLLFGWLPW